MNAFPSALWRLFKSSLLVPVLLACASAMAASDEEWLYTVNPGDTLTQIAEKYLDRPSGWKALQKLNKVNDPNRLKPGGVLRIPYALSSQSASFAEVVWVRGEAFRASKSLPVAIAQGDQLKMGDTVQTGHNSSVTLRFLDQSRLLVSADSRIKLARMIHDRKSGQSKTQVLLEAGSAESIVTPNQSVDAHYEVKTPALTLAVRGTRFRVMVDSQTGMTRGMVSEGTVVASAQNKSVKLTEGMGTVAAPGAAPSAPQALLAAPELETPAVSPVTLPVKFSWMPLARAQQYRVELLDREGKTQLDELLVATTQARWDSLANGQYQLRIRGIDSQGLEGKPAAHVFTLNARPEPPMLRLPVGGSIVNGEKVAFRWAVSPNIQYYRFEVSDKADFSHMISLSKQLPGNLLGVHLTLPPGKYFWRVAAATPEAGFGPYSDAQPFEVQKSAVAGKVAMKDAPEPVTLRWKEGGPGQKYQIQVSLEPEFNAPLLDVVQSEPQVAVERKGQGPYYVRLRRIDPDGLAVAFEATQQFSLDPSP